MKLLRSSLHRLQHSLLNFTLVIEHGDVKRLDDVNYLSKNDLELGHYNLNQLYLLYQLLVYSREPRIS